jgi:inhibitor of cysteine peptidase
LPSKLILGLAAIVLAGSAALAELCPKCRDKAYIQSIGTCAECGGATSSGAFKLCKKCSAKLGQCEHCRAPLLVKGADVTVGEEANGKTVAAEEKQTLLVKLAGNITTGYSWGLRKLEGEAIEMVGKPEYVADKAPQKMVGSGGVFHLTFRAIKPGKATIALGYARPWEKDTPPAKTFALTVEVKPREPKAKP